MSQKKSGDNSKSVDLPHEALELIYLKKSGDNSKSSMGLSQTKIFHGVRRSQETIASFFPRPLLLER